MNAIHCMVMLEDQHEEQACLYILGMLSEEAAASFEELAATDPKVARAATDFEESLTNLSLAITPFRQPRPTLKNQILDRIDREPARVTTDLNGCIQTINPAFTSMCGYRFDELRGQVPGHILQGPETDSAAVETLRRAIRERTGCEVRMLNYHKNGSSYWVNILIQPLHDAAGNVIGFRAEERQIETSA